MDYLIGDAETIEEQNTLKEAKKFLNEYRRHKRRQAPTHIIHQVQRDLRENISSLLAPEEYKILERARKLLEVCAK